VVLRAFATKQTARIRDAPAATGLFRGSLGKETAPEAMFTELIHTVNEYYFLLLLLHLFANSLHLPANSFHLFLFATRLPPRPALEASSQLFMALTRHPRRMKRLA
jgi:hypothetical protein